MHLSYVTPTVASRSCTPPTTRPTTHVCLVGARSLLGLLRYNRAYLTALTPFLSQSPRRRPGSGV
eukprot:1539345-Prymnesium_polylepis.1